MSQISWPSSIAVFGPTTPRTDTPQRTVLEPTTMYGVSKVSGENLCNYYFNRYGLDVRGLRMPESLVKRLVNHAPSHDVTEGYAAEWTREELHEASQRIADRVEALAMAEPQGLRAALTGCEGLGAR